MGVPVGCSLRLISGMVWWSSVQTKIVNASLTFHRNSEQSPRALRTRDEGDIPFDRGDNIVAQQSIANGRNGSARRF